MKSGEGVETTSFGTCTGQFAREKLNGEAVCDYHDGQRYVGRFVDGRREGQGTMSSPS